MANNGAPIMLANGQYAWPGDPGYAEATRGPLTEGTVADGNTMYGFNRPNAGMVYSNGTWVTPSQAAANKASIASQGTMGTAANKLNTLLTDPSSVADTPAYQFAYNQGLEGVNRTAAAKGMLGSGNRLYDLTKYGQGLASQTYSNTVNSLGNFLNKTPMTQAASTPYKLSSSGSTQTYDLGGTY